MKKILTTAVAAVISLASLTAASYAANAYGENTPDSIEIIVDYGEYEDELPVGKVGKSYPVFAGVVTDESGNVTGEPDVRVYSPDGTLLPIKNGRFATAVAGKYRIEYYASAGALSAEETVEVTVDDTAAPLVYTLDENFPDSAYCGENVFLTDGTRTGGVGAAEIVLTITADGEKIDVSDTRDGDFFIPEKAGTYDCVYTVTDFVGDEITVSESIEVTENLRPMFGKPSVATVATVGEKVNLPLADGVIYRGGVKYYLPVTVRFDGEDVTDTLSFTADEVGEKTLEFICENPFEDGYETSYSFVITVSETDDESPIYTRRFAFDNFEAISTEDDELYKIKALSVGDAVAAFATAIPCEYLSVGLKGEKATDIYTSCTLVMTDSLCEEDRIEVGLGKLYTYGEFYAAYDEETYTLVDEKGKKLFDIEYYADGRKFGGFPSGKARVSVVLNGVTENTEMAFTSLGGVSVTTSAFDGAEPAFLSNPKLRTVSVAYFGQTVTLPEMKAFDIFDDEPTVRVRITDPDRQVVYTGEIDGEYSFTVEKYGAYLIRYVASDSSGNERPITCTVNALDIIPPEITVGKIKTEVSVGETLTLPAAEISDNASAADKITSYIYALYGNNVKELITDRTFTFEKKGVYIIRYVAYDAFENYTTVEFTVTCR